MAQENFPPMRVWDASIKAHRTFQVVKCSQCEAFENIPTTGKTAMPPEAIVKRMQARGWVMGHRRRHDICPACATKKASRPKVTKLSDYLKNNEPERIARGRDFNLRGLEPAPIPSIPGRDIAVTSA